MNEQPSTAVPQTPPPARLENVAQDALHLVQQEWALARQETVEKFTPAVRSIVMLFGGGVLVLIGSVYFLQFIVRVLTVRLPGWLASLVSGVVFAVGGAWLAQRGRQQLQYLNLVPQKTINSLQEDKEWLLHQIKSRLT